MSKCFLHGQNDASLPWYSDFCNFAESKNFNPHDITQLLKLTKCSSLKYKKLRITRMEDVFSMTWKTLLNCN